MLSSDCISNPDACADSQQIAELSRVLTINILIKLRLTSPEIMGIICAIS